jgi:hypothetical protein
VIVLSEVYWSPNLPAPLPFMKTVVDDVESTLVSGPQPAAACDATMSPILTAPIALMNTLLEHSLVAVVIGFAQFLPEPVRLYTESTISPLAAAAIYAL